MILLGLKSRIEKQIKRKLTAHQMAILSDIAKQHKDDLNEALDDEAKQFVSALEIARRMKEK